MAKILIVDDEERMLKLFSEILLKEGFEVFSASDSKSGFDLAASEKPDLILLDIMMPYTDGTQMFEALSKDSRTKDIRVVFLTSLITEEEMKAGHGNIGGREYISKSVSRSDFVRKVRELLGISS